MKLPMLAGSVTAAALVLAPLGAWEAPPARPQPLPQPLRLKISPADPVARSLPSCDPRMTVGFGGLGDLVACDPRIVIGRGMHPERMDRMNVLRLPAPVLVLPKR